MEIESNVHLVMIVLGKRLKDDGLTLEGQSRVKALFDAQQHQAQLAGASVIFCGGVTEGQTTSEAQRMHQAYLACCQSHPPRYPAGNVYLEDKSTTTVENIRFVSEILVNQIVPAAMRNGSAALQVASQPKPCLQVMFVSNDYHLQRIFEIQRLMPQQGLLRLMEQHCARYLVPLRLSYQIEQHLVAAYPYQSEQAALFLLADELTTYRVYLEGRLQGNLPANVPESAAIRQAPLAIAEKALDRMLTRVRNIDGTHVMSSNIPFNIASCVSQLAAWTKLNPDPLSQTELADLVQHYHQHLLSLNRYLDPEGCEAR